MNLKDNFPNKALLLLAVLFSIAVFLFLLSYFKKYEQQLEQDKKQILGAIDKILGQQDTKGDLKTLRYKALSPDKSQEVIIYKLSFTPLLYEDYYKDYFPNNTIVAVREIKTKREDHVFIGEERTGNPHWLGNNHIFFTTYCGTACKGIYLVDVKDKETRLGVLSYVFSEQDGWQTHFKDWFGEEFVFKGLVDKMGSETKGNISHLIFKMKGDEGIYLGEKRFLFTGKSLLEEK